jgi:hypothetical protein
MKGNTFPHPINARRAARLSLLTPSADAAFAVAPNNRRIHCAALRTH